MRSGSGFVVAVLVIGACACTSLSPAGRLYETYARIDGGKVAGEIERWEGVAQDAPDDALRAGAHLRLALLLSHPEHPEPDYRRALEELERYRSLDPRGGGDLELRRLLGVLSDLRRCELQEERRRELVELLWKEEQDVRRRLEELRQDSRGVDGLLDLVLERERALERQNQELTREHEEMAERLRELESGTRTLEAENRELKETLERLKNLDLQLERMRSGEAPR